MPNEDPWVMKPKAVKGWCLAKTHGLRSLWLWKADAWQRPMGDDDPWMMKPMAMKGWCLTKTHSWRRPMGDEDPWMTKPMAVKNWGLTKTHGWWRPMGDEEPWMTKTHVYFFLGRNPMSRRRILHQTRITEAPYIILFGVKTNSAKVIFLVKILRKWCVPSLQAKGYVSIYVLGEDSEAPYSGPKGVHSSWVTATMNFC